MASSSTQSRRSGRRRVSSPSSQASSPQLAPAANRQRQRGETQDDTEARRMLSETPSPTCPNPILTQESRIETVVIDSLGEVPAALRLFQAIKHASALGAIGYCPSKVEALAARIADGNSAELSLDDMNRAGDHGYARLTDEDKDREARNSETIVALREIATLHARNSASGILDKPFRLRINRRDIKFDEDIPPRAKSSLSYGSLPAAAVTELEPRLEKWHSNAKVSGYGDVREQVTKVDKNVRHAKEIPASEFSVNSELLERIADIWDQNFFPNSGVRVEPYKINLYGPGGHFAVHRDTLQQGLVGTFLLGLGDTADYGGLTVDGEIRPAYEGHWTAFYPDVPHKVEELDGYRAAIAFKLFRTPDAENANAKETDKSVTVRQQVSQLVGSMEAPFGILLQRKYCLGTTVFSGFDAVLMNAACTLPGVEVKHLPIILRSSAKWSDLNSEFADLSSYNLKCSTAVYPFTKGHVETLIEYVEHSTANPANHSACGAPWLEGVEAVPFFSLDLEQSLFTYQEDLHDTSVYLGNEVEMCREDSIYLSYALLVLPSDESSKSGDDDDSE